jgi:hypothetical protein
VLFKTSDNLLNFKATLARVNEEAGKVGTSTEEMERFIKSIERTGEMAVQAGEMTMAEYSKVLAQANAAAEQHARAATAFDAMDTAAGQAMGVGGVFQAAQSIHNLTDAFHQASAENAQAATDSARRILTANNDLVTALVGGPGTVEMALKKLQSLASGGDGGSGLKLPPIQFGPNQINIKQDFRDQDPDRVAIVFRRDVVKQSVQRIGAATGSPFGF